MADSDPKNSFLKRFTLTITMILILLGMVGASYGYAAVTRVDLVAYEVGHYTVNLPDNYKKTSTDESKSVLEFMGPKGIKVSVVTYRSRFSSDPDEVVQHLTSQLEIPIQQITRFDPDRISLSTQSKLSFSAYEISSPINDSGRRKTILTGIILVKSLDNPEDWLLLRASMLGDGSYDAQLNNVLVIMKNSAAYHPPSNEVTGE